MGWGVGGDAVNLVTLSVEGMGQAVGGNGGTASAYEVGQDADSHKARVVAFRGGFF